MKKIVFSILILLLIHCSLRGGITILRGGITASAIGTSGDDKNSELTWTVGLGTEFGSLVNKIRFQSDVLFSYEKINLGPTNRTYRLIKLSMPLLFKYKLKPIRSPYFLAGGAGSLIFADEAVVDGKAVPLAEASIVIGAGMEFDFRRRGRYTGNSIVIEGRYQRGLNKLKIYNVEYRQNSFYLLIGFKFFGI